MQKNDISLIINCSKENIENIDKTFFKNYQRIYFNIFPDDRQYLEKIIEDMKTKYYSIWEYNSNYNNIDNLDIILNKNYEEGEEIKDQKIEYISNPDISVIVCLYNTEPDFFQKAINGLLSQTFTNFEVLIVNDGSTKYFKENRSLIKKLNDNRFIWFDKEHSGKSQTLNLALSKAKGKYIAINDSDDISEFNRLEYQYEWLENHNNYDYISNRMIRINDLVIFPNNFKESQEVKPDNIHYCTNHPCSMFKKGILNQIPFWFSQFYDSYEDCAFHYICFYYGVKMYYDNEILMQYAYRPEGQVHYENIIGFKHDAHYKITFKTFNIDRKQSDFGIYLILFDKNLWNNVELEKTLLNIRISSNDVSIYILYNDQFNIYVLKEISEKYGINNYINFKNQYSFFNKEYYEENLEYIGIISKPVRFYQQDWDIKIRRKLDIYYYNIIQPLLFDIQKINDNTYINESGKNQKEYNYGERLTPLCDKLTEENEEYYAISNNEYLKELDIPVLSNDNIFFLRNITWKNLINDLQDINIYELSNTFISCSLYKYFKQSPKIDSDIEIGTLNYTNNIRNYYNNYKLFIYKYMNETIYLHEQLLKDICKANNIELDDISYNSYINDFLKKQNKQSWTL